MERRFVSKWVFIRGKENAGFLFASRWTAAFLVAVFPSAWNYYATDRWGENHGPNFDRRG
jgi:hypothetical protein